MQYNVACDKCNVMHLLLKKYTVFLLKYHSLIKMAASVPLTKYMVIKPPLHAKASTSTGNMW